MKKLIWIVVLVLVIVGAYMLWSDGAPMANAETAEGTIISVNTEGVALDGPALVTIDTEDGEKVIAVPSMGINLCTAREDIADVYELTAGDMVSVRGEADEEGRIVPCTDASHYLRVTEATPAE